MVLVAATTVAPAVASLPAQAAPDVSPPAAALVGDQATVLHLTVTNAPVVGGELDLIVEAIDDSGPCNVPYFPDCDAPSGTVDLSLSSGSGGDVAIGHGDLVSKGDDRSVLDWTGPAPVTAGTHTLTAHYPGDGHFRVHDATTSVTVGKAPTSVAAQQSSTSSGVGDDVTFTAQIAVNVTAGSPAVGGSVQFRRNGSPLGPLVAVNPGGSTGWQAVLTTSDLPAGTSTITASYSGDGNYLAANTNAPLNHSTKYGLSLPACPPNCKTIGPVKTGPTAGPTGTTAITLGCLPHCVSLTATSPSLPPAATATSPATTKKPTTTAPVTATVTPSGGTDAAPTTGGGAASASDGSGFGSVGTSGSVLNAAGDSDAAVTAGSTSVALGAGGSGSAGSASAESGSAQAGSAQAGSALSPASDSSAVAALAAGQPRAATGQADTGFLQSHIWLLFVILAVLLLLAGFAAFLVVRRRRPDDQVQ